MTTHDIIILAYPIIGATAMSALSFVAIYVCGYHKPAPRISKAIPASAPSETINQVRLVERVLLSLSEAELDYVAERSAALASRAKAQREATHA